MTDESAIQVGVLVPLTRPGWVEAGRHLLAGIELAARDVNDAGGIAGKPLELVIRDTAGNAQTAAAAVDELARLGVAALRGVSQRRRSRCCCQGRRAWCAVPLLLGSARRSD
jgi:ABC-type branched-subunit amino acid transport system substrate-binding protein